MEGEQSESETVAFCSQEEFLAALQVHGELLGQSANRHNIHLFNTLSAKDEITRLTLVLVRRDGRDNSSTDEITRPSVYRQKPHITLILTLLHLVFLLTLTFLHSTVCTPGLFLSSCTLFSRAQ